ncbi:hypothetical protein JNK13_04780 [bacterium]|nr:hypothetical protein [bacterium]
MTALVHQGFKASANNQIVHAVRKKQMAKHLETPALPPQVSFQVHMGGLSHGAAKRIAALNNDLRENGAHRSLTPEWLVMACKDSALVVSVSTPMEGLIGFSIIFTGEGFMMPEQDEEFAEEGIKQDDGRYWMPLQPWHEEVSGATGIAVEDLAYRWFTLIHPDFRNMSIGKMLRLMVNSALKDAGYEGTYFDMRVDVPADYEPSDAIANEWSEITGTAPKNEVSFGFWHDKANPIKGQSVDCVVDGKGMLFQRWLDYLTRA